MIVAVSFIPHSAHCRWLLYLAPITMISIYGIKNCDTMKKAFDWLKEHHIDYTFHNYKEEGIGADKLKSWLKQVPPDVLINTRGTTFKALSDDEKAGISDPKKAIALMMVNPSMIKRPVVETASGLVLGFKAADWAQQVK